MKLLAVSDVVEEALYSDAVRNIAEKADAVLSCGDLPAPYLEFILTVLDVPLIYVPGNHDRPIHTANGRVVAGPEGAIAADGRVVEVPLRTGETLVCVGLGGSMHYGGDVHQHTERQMRARMRRLAPRLCWNQRIARRPLHVLLTHAAPAGIHNGTDRCHVGFSTFLEFMRRYRPRLLVHGHVHPAYGFDTAPRRFDHTSVISVYGHEMVEIAC